jgi:hypothetical protein
VLRILVILSILIVAPLGAQEAPPPQKPPEPAKQEEKKEEKKPGALKPYKDVVTAEAKSDEGLFTVHRVGDRTLFEIPPSELGQEFLWTVELERVPPGTSWGSYNGAAMGSRVVRWERRGNKIFLRNVDYSYRADPTKNISVAVQAVMFEPIIAAWDVETENETSKAAVIDVSKYFVSDPQEFSVKRGVGGDSPDEARSYIETCKAFPENVNTRVVLTFRQGNSGQAASVTAYHSMVRLPKNPMMPRLWDSRVGYWEAYHQDFGADTQKVHEVRYITRYRLEKKDPTADLSEPLRPIVFYLAREIPEKWRPYLKKGVEDWQVAFEAAGFKNAIIAKDAPSKEEDPDWDPEDARYNVIRWAPSTIENAMGPHIHDPRTGEILQAHIIFWHNALKLARDWYFVQASPNDSRSQKLPLPDDVLGECLRYICAHEVGHTLGFPHNMKASSSFSVKELRDPAFTKQWGTEASIMDYGRFNYVCQPGDGAHLIPKIGPYDIFAVRWGYAPIPGAATPADEKPILDAWAADQVSNPKLRFGANDYEDPSQQTEDLGDDPVEATALGLKNIKRVASYLIAATVKPGEDYTELNDMYNQLVGQYVTELHHVVTLVGGVVMTNYHGGRGGAVYNPVPAAKQREAVMFLLENAFRIPKPLLDPQILYRLKPQGTADSFIAAQRGFLGRLLSDDRVRRMLDTEAGGQVKNPYTLSQLVSDLQEGIFSELRQKKPAVDLYRRNLQRAYVEILINKKTEGYGDLRPLALAALESLQTQIANALPRAADGITTAHLRGLRALVRDALRPKP